MEEEEQNVLILLELYIWLAIIFYIGYLAYIVLGILSSLDMLEKITPWFIERNCEIKELMSSPFR